MAVKLNLLPQDYSVSGSVAQIIKIARPLNIILLGTFLITALGMAGFFIFSSITLKNLNTTNNTLKRQIQAQETAQQQIVLLKDRLGKIKKVFAKPSANKNLAIINPIIANLPDSVLLSELNLDPLKSNIVLNFKTNSDLTNFIDYINSESKFSNISMDNFNYSQQVGYLVGFSFIPKN